MKALGRLLPTATCTLALLCAIRAQASPDALPPSAADAAADSTLNSAYPRLLELLMSGIERTEPSANIITRSGGETVFDGSYDWHSCISAHWAALCMARVFRDRAIEARILDRLSPAVLEHERELFAQVDAQDVDGSSQRTRGARSFFMPFADAWLLLLLAEVARHDGRDTAELRAFRAETENRVLRHLESSAFPDGRNRSDTDNPVFEGAYRSFLFACLALHLAGTVGAESAPRLQAIETTKVDPWRPRLCTDVARLPADFLDLRAIFALIERLRDQGPAPLASTPIRLPEKVSIGDCHVLGRIVTATWPLAFDAATDPGARAAFVARTAAFLTRRDLWDGDFGATQHWVPQYLWLGLWLARGRD